MEERSGGGREEIECGEAEREGGGSEGERVMGGVRVRREVEERVVGTRRENGGAPSQGL